jgi:hypothetical protein
MENSTGEAFSFKYEAKWENGTNFQVLENYLEIRFRGGGLNRGDDEGWATEPRETFTNTGKTYEQHYGTEEGVRTKIYQLVGNCGKEMSHIRIRSRRLKFTNFSKDGKYIHTDYN